MELAGVGDDFAEVAVDAEPDAALGFLGLDVDVGGAFADGEVDDLVDEGDDGVGVGDGGEFVAGEVGLVEDGGAFEAEEAVFEAFFVGVVDRDGVFDFAGECEDGAQGDLRDLAEAADEVGIVGGCERDGE